MIDRHKLKPQRLRNLLANFIRSLVRVIREPSNHRFNASVKRRQIGVDCVYTFGLRDRNVDHHKGVDIQTDSATQPTPPKGEQRRMSLDERRLAQSGILATDTALRYPMHIQ